MWHYRAIMKIVFQNKMVHCPIITLCKISALPTLKSPAPATHFWQLSSHHPSYQKHVASRVLLRVFIRTYLLNKLFFSSQEIHQLFLSALCLKRQCLHHLLKVHSIFNRKTLLTETETANHQNLAPSKDKIAQQEYGFLICQNIKQ